MTETMKTLTVEEVAEYLRKCEDHAHYAGRETAEDGFTFAVKLVRAHGLCLTTVTSRTDEGRRGK